MILITSNAQRILQWYKDSFVDFKMQQEYGRSAFWLWYDQICVEIRELEIKQLPFGYYLKASMNYWGDIIYSKESICGIMILKIENFDFDLVKFKDWLLHIERHRIPYSICDTCFGFSNVLYDNSQKYGILKPNGEPLIKPIFDDIINFHHSSNDFNTLHAIGFINDRVYEITTDGNITLLHISKEDYLNATHRFSESVHRQKIIENKQYMNMKNKKQLIRLTEGNLHRIIKESVKRVLKEGEYNIGTGSDPEIEEINSALHDILSDVEWMAQEKGEENPEDAKRIRAAYNYLTRAYNILLGGMQDDSIYGEYDDDSVRNYLSRKSLGHDKYGRYERYN